MAGQARLVGLEPNGRIRLAVVRQKFPEPEPGAGRVIAHEALVAPPFQHAAMGQA